MKKLLSLILSVILVLSCLTVPAFSADGEYVSADEMELLYALGIISSPELSEAQLGAHITRGEATKYFCDVLDLEVADAEGFDSVFYDVTSETPNFKYISTICKAGYMQGDGNSRFRPNSAISTMEAARVIASLTGYKGYIAVTSLDNVVNKTGILNGVPVKSEVELGQFLKMIYNILHAPACVLTGYGSDAVDFRISEDCLGVEYLFNIVLDRGIVTATPASSLTKGNSGVKPGCVTVDGYIHAYSGDSTEFFGYSVDYYYKKNTSLYDIIYMKKSDLNETMTLDYDKIVGYSNFTYSYDANNTVKKVNIEPDTDIIYNGVACIAPSNADMVPQFGQVILIDNDNDRKYEVAHIENYEFMVVDSVNVEKQIIKDKDKTTTLNLEDADEVLITLGDKVYSLDRLYMGNLLKIKRSKEDSGYYQVMIEINKDEVAGAAITATGKNTITVLGKTYPLWDNMKPSSRANIVVGKIVSLYISDGIVVRIEKENSNNNYAYLLAISKPETFSDEIQFKLVLSDTTAVILEKGKSVKIDGISLKTAAQIEGALQRGAALAALPNASYPIAQPVRYTLNKTGQLATLDTFYQGTNEDSDSSLHKLETKEYRYRSTSSSLYDKTTSDFEAVSTNFFRIPKTDRDSFFDYASTAPSDRGAGVMEICNIDDGNKKAEMVYMYYDPYKTGTSAPYVVIDKLTEVDSNGDVKETLVLGRGKSVYNFGVTDEMLSTYAGLEIGDLISITLNFNTPRDVRGITKQYSISVEPALEERVTLKKAAYNDTTNPPYVDGDRVVYGTALNVEDGHLLITPSLPSDVGGLDTSYKVDNIVITDVPIWKYSVKRGLATIEQVDASEILSYAMDPAEPSTVVIDIQSSKVTQVFVIER